MTNIVWCYLAVITVVAMVLATCGGCGPAEPVTVIPTDAAAALSPAATVDDPGLAAEIAVTDAYIKALKKAKARLPLSGEPAPDRIQKSSRAQRVPPGSSTTTST